MHERRKKYEIKQTLFSKADIPEIENHLQSSQNTCIYKFLQSIVSYQTAALQLQKRR